MTEAVATTFEVTTPVREIATAMPATTRVFQKFRIDYCCGGAATLEQACSSAGVSIDEVLEAIEALRAKPQDVDWTRASMTELADYIVRKHHVYTRDETEALVMLANKVERVHGSNHPEVIDVAEIVNALRSELLEHMMKEEQILFPFVSRLEQQLSAGGPATQAPFGTVQNPIRMMMFEHDHAADMLRTLRRKTDDYRLPDDACMS
ncbi:MAG: DUF542 domain-containing protein, partial [Thermoanaerobaculia bacterium]|nr:DUF542 domain-containing protein [Thermoanaerobaculia bacterium]